MEFPDGLCIIMTATAVIGRQSRQETNTRLFQETDRISSFDRGRSGGLSPYSMSISVYVVVLTSCLMIKRILRLSVLLEYRQVVKQPACGFGKCL
jgi:hypothetical protein